MTVFFGPSRSVSLRALRAGLLASAVAASVWASAAPLALGAASNASAAPRDLLATAPSAVVQTEQVRAELVAHAPRGIAPGQPLQLGLWLQHQLHWHTYWKNPGDSGLPTTLNWTLPKGWKASDIQWPTPTKLPVGTLANYGYEGSVLLPVAITLPANAGKGAPVKIRAQLPGCRGAGACPAKICWLTASGSPCQPARFSA